MTKPIRDISEAELSNVVGGTGATTLPQAIGNYFMNNGDGSLLSKAGVLGAKVGRRLEYSLGITRTIGEYTDQIRGLPGGAEYLDDVNRLRPPR